jgi:CubicO group peptidase (beta-lactamase class C family)
MDPKLLVAGLALLLAGCTEKGDRLMQERYPAGGPGAAVAVISDGSVLYSHTFGLANLEHRIPVSDETVFDGASIAKQFTAFAVLSLAHEGLFRLDDVIDPYVGELLPIALNKGITIRHLLSHTSGIRDYVWATTTTGRRFDDVQTSAHVERFLLGQNGLSHDPGIEWAYNNTGYFILGKIVAQKAKKSLAAYLDETVFRPFGMTRTFLLEDPTQIIAHRAESYGPANEFCYGLAPGAKLARCIDSTALPGPASLMTTLPDMIKWLVQINKGVSAGDARFLQLFAVSTSSSVKPGFTDCGPESSDKAAYAGGMYIDEIEGVKIACHGGTWRGFRALVLFVPSHKLTIVILSNRGDTLPYLRDAAFALANLYEPALKLKLPPSIARSRPECGIAQTADLVGTYYSAELKMALTFQIDNAGHFVGMNLQRGSARLCHDTAETFRNTDEAFKSFASIMNADDNFQSFTSFWLTRAKFVRNDQGRVSAVEISPLTAAEDIVFMKLP